MADSSQKIKNFPHNLLQKIREFLQSKSKRFKILLAITLGVIVLTICASLALVLLNQNTGVGAKIFNKKKTYTCSPLVLLQDLRREQDEKQAALFALYAKYSHNIQNKKLASELRQLSIVYKDDQNHDVLQECLAQADPKWEKSVVLLQKHKRLIVEYSNSISLVNQGREADLNLIVLDLNENKDEFEESLLEGEVE